MSDLMIRAYPPAHCIKLQKYRIYDLHACEEMTFVFSQTRTQALKMWKVILV